MALIVEDGTGKSDAESYVSVADATSYHALRGNTTWALLSNDEMEQALRRATDYLVQMYRLSWKGSRLNAEQSLDFPRTFMERDDFSYSGMNGYTVISGNFYYPSDIVPVEIKNATSELALKASADELAPDVGQRVLREKIDVIEVQYAEYGVQYTSYRAVENMIKPYLSGQGGAMRKTVRT